ncbi:MAG TPA: alpha/beta hydrolase [Actinomycetota bacterium]|nr:alpha/beta hydrolase [Actinomycetota bacterium]
MTTTLERKRARVSAGDMAYAEEGSGPAVVLLHGFPTSAHLWSDLVPLLAPRFRAIAPDLIGYGDSAKPPDARLDVRAQAGYVRELLEQLGVSGFAAVGHDIGGGVAQLLALEGGVHSLVLIDSTASGSPARVEVIQPTDRSDVDAGFAEGYVRAHLERGMSRPKRLFQEDLEEFVRPWRQDPSALARAARDVDGDHLGDTATRLKALDIPSLVLWGEDDPYQPTELAERLWDLLPDASIALLPGCSHYVMKDAAETVLPLITQFLRKRYLGEEGHGHEHTAGPVAIDLGVSFERPPHPGDELVDE